MAARSTRPRARISGCAGAAVAIALLTAGCGTSTTSHSPATPTTTRIAISNYAYHPPDLTVQAGTRVTFTNRDATAHTATATSGAAFDTGTLKSGQSRTITFSKPGTFTYYCQFHAFMHGTITVR